MGNTIGSGGAKGRVAVISGAASGIGLAAAHRCASLVRSTCSHPASPLPPPCSPPAATLEAGWRGLQLMTGWRGGQGMKTVIVDINPEALEAAEAELQQRHPGAITMSRVVDVSDLQSVSALHDAGYSSAEFGECGFLFNNAGGSWEEGFSAYDTPLDQWDRTLKVNLYGVLHSEHRTGLSVCQSVTPRCHLSSDAERCCWQCSSSSSPRSRALQRQPGKELLDSSR